MSEFQKLAIPDVILVTPKRHGDARGWFSEVYQAERYAAGGIEGTFVQDNHSLSVAKGVLRGLHFQTNPVPQAKLVRCTRGRIFDVAVDLRHGSPTYAHHVSVELCSEKGQQLFVPVGFAHAFCTLEENCEVQYKVSGPYSPECDGGVAFNDPGLAIEWPFPINDLVISDKDKGLPRLAELPELFHY